MASHHVDLVLHRLFAVEVGEDERDGGETDGRGGEDAAPQAAIEVGAVRHLTQTLTQ